MITIYLTNDVEFTDSEILYFEKAIGREIGDGGYFLNVYTSDLKIVQDLIDLIGESYIQEVAS